MASAHGTRLHNFAKDAILLGQKADPRKKTTMNMYINDGIGFRLTPEVPLYVSDFAFGHADTLGFRKEKREDGTMWPKLRVSDLKTGVSVSYMHQLEVYTAYFCLEYFQKPHEIDMELRIYQNDDIQIHFPDPDKILRIMDRTLTFSDRITQLREEAL